MSLEQDNGTGSTRSGDAFDASVTSIGALAEPVRRDLYRFVVAQPEPVSREQAAAGAGVARHVAKFHLDKLVEDGLLDVSHRRQPGRSGPGAGRPAKVYRRSEREVTVSLPPRRYEFAGQLLAQAIVAADRDDVPILRALKGSAREAGKTLGRTARRDVTGDPGPSAPRDAAMKALEEAGFEPRRDESGVTLANCPFDSLAREHTALACGMNLELMRGFLAGLEGAELDAKLDPSPGRCCVKLRCG
jgi:predicted ArsR family transcriptional regulator